MYLRYHRQEVGAYLSSRQKRGCRGRNVQEDSRRYAINTYLLNLQHSSSAYNIISDPKKRRVFDSQEPFDDSIPSVNEQGNFFDIYGPAFKRFAKYCC